MHNLSDLKRSKGLRESVRESLSQYSHLFEMSEPNYCDDYTHTHAHNCHVILSCSLTLRVIVNGNSS